MEKTPNIYQRIIEVMKEVKYVQKSDKKVNGQYSFVTHDAVSAALHDPMAKNGIVMTSTILELTQDGNRTTAKIEISFINCDQPTDRVNIVYYGYGIDPQDKGIGKAISYAIKYALLKTFCLETGDDVERDNIDYQPSKPAVDPEVLKKALADRKKEIMGLVGEENIEFLKDYVKDLKTIYKNKKEEDLFLGMKASDFCNHFTKWVEKRQS